MVVNKGSSSLVSGSRPLEELSRQRDTTIDALIRDALKTGGSITGAARVLGVNRNTVRHHMKRMKIQVEISYRARVVRITEG